MKKSYFNKGGDWIYFCACIMAFMIWSTSFIATKMAYESFAPITLGATRFVVAFFLLAFVLLCKREFVKPTPKDFGLISLSGVFGITLYFSMENIGVKLTSASNAALIVASYPAITALLELAIYKIRITKRKMAGIALAALGVYILSYVRDQFGGREQIVGNLTLIATGVVWAFYNFTTRKIANKYPAVTLSFYQTLAGTFFLLPLTLFERGSWQYPTALSTALMLYLGIFCSVIAYLLYNFGLRRLSSSTSVALMNLVPIFGVLFSVLILGESVSARQFIGGAIVLVGVMLSVRQNKDGSEEKPASDGNAEAVTCEENR